MFTKKHYIEIAKIFKEQYEIDKETNLEKDLSDIYSIKEGQQHAMEDRTFFLMQKFEAMFTADNLKFDLTTFRKYVFGKDYEQLKKNGLITF